MITNEDYLIQLDEQLKPLVRKYISSRGRILNGRTVTAVQLNIENCMDDMDEIQKDMMAIANKLKKENSITPTAELKEQIHTRYIDTLKSISNYRISGKFPG